MSASKSISSRNPRYSHKRNEATILSLREELQLLYRSLQTKNEELISLERTILDRDHTISGLAEENRRLNASVRAKRSSSTPKTFSAHIETDRMAKKSEIASERSDSSSSLGKLSDIELIREQNDMIKELNDKVMRLSRNLNFVQRTLHTREERIGELLAEIDKFRQIVRPITKAMTEQKTCRCIDEVDGCIHAIGDWSPGLESTRVLPMKEAARIKRQAISAEPLSALAGSSDDGLVRIPKSSL